MSNAITFIVFILVIMSAAYVTGSDKEMQRIKQKCLIEMEDKPLKEATKICTEIVK